MFAQIYIASFAMDLISKGFILKGPFDEAFKSFFVWLGVEAIVMASALISNATFLIIRTGFLKQRILLFFPNAFH